MYRVIFKSVDPHSQKLLKECGPWLPYMEDAERWAAYFNDQGHHAHAIVEKASNNGSKIITRFGYARGNLLEPSVSDDLQSM